MTIGEFLHKIIDAPEDNRGIGTYHANIKGARLLKNGLTQITLTVNVSEFTPQTVLEGIQAWVSIGTNAALNELRQQEPKS